MALKDFFPSKITSKENPGEAVSSQYIKSLISELIEQEDKKKPLSDEEIAALQGVSEGTIKSRMSRAKGKLCEALKGGELHG
jgi:RNA polymerase sigma-54 factor